MESSIKLIAAAGGAIASFLWGGWSVLIQVLLFMNVLDYLSGMMAAWYEGKLNSKKGFRGIAKKVMMLAIIATANVVDVILGGNTHFIRDAVICFYLVNEILSITENGGRMGLPMPKVLRNALEALNSDIEDNKTPEPTEPVKKAE